jgi:hypothetical protein
MLLVHALWAQGWHHATAAATALAPGDQLATWAGPALVQDRTPTEILLRVDGEPLTLAIRLGEMEVRLAAVLVRHRAEQTGLALDAHVAALWVFGGEETLAAAREAIVEAAQRGVYVDHLIAELLQAQEP